MAAATPGPIFFAAASIHALGASPDSWGPGGTGGAGAPRTVAAYRQRADAAPAHAVWQGRSLETASTCVTSFCATPIGRAWRIRWRSVCRWLTTTCFSGRRRSWRSRQGLRSSGWPAARKGGLPEACRTRRKTGFSTPSGSGSGSRPGNRAAVIGFQPPARSIGRVVGHRRSLSEYIYGVSPWRR